MYNIMNVSFYIVYVKCVGVFTNQIRALYSFKLYNFLGVTNNFALSLRYMYTYIEDLSRVVF